MKLQDLKAYAIQAWSILHEVNGVVLQDGQFKPEVRRIGDMRRKSTWMRAGARFAALYMIDTCIDPWEIITIQLNFHETREDYELRHLIIDEFLSHPDGPDIIRAGLEQLFSADFTETERKPAYGLLEMVAERRPGERILFDAVELDRRRPELTGTPRA